MLGENSFVPKQFDDAAMLREQDDDPHLPTDAVLCGGERHKIIGRNILSFSRLLCNVPLPPSSSRLHSSLALAFTLLARRSPNNNDNNYDCNDPD